MFGSGDNRPISGRDQKNRRTPTRAADGADDARGAFKTEVDGDVDEGDPNFAEREKVMALVRGLRRKLESIEKALRQAQQGQYGICERCGEAIDPARLEVVPEATLCVRCKTLVERRRRMGQHISSFG